MLLKIIDAIVFGVWDFLDWLFSPISNLWWKIKRHPDDKYADEETINFVKAIEYAEKYTRETGISLTLARPRGDLYSPRYYKLTDPFRKILYTKRQWQEELAWRLYKSALKREARERGEADEAARKLIGGDPD